MSENGLFLSGEEIEQELSYRKQIARQLRTQFVEGISVILKSTLRVTQGHWKQNHWTVNGVTLKTRLGVVQGH